MNKQIVNEDEFIGLCNKELRNQPEYEEGMEIIGVPGNTSGSDLSGYKWKGSDSIRSIVSKVVDKVKLKHELHITPRQQS
jgi:hypothetical protein